MQTDYEETKSETEQLENLLQMEELAAKKAGIYSRLLIDARLAQKMEGIEKGHKERAKAIENLLYVRPKKQKAGEQVRGESK